MNMKLKTFPIVLAIVSTASFSANAVNIVNDANHKQIGHVKWDIEIDSSSAELLNKDIPEDSVSLFFFRTQDDDHEQTSANITVNDRFQVSLQPGRYTQVYSCPGINRISADITRDKSNDFLKNAFSYSLAADNNYFFLIDVDSDSKSSIQKIDQEQALQYLSANRYQSHQISRVVPNCPEMELTEPVSPTVVLEEEVSIELEVLFDNDKAIIKPDYYHEVGEVADFMTKYSNTKAVIEGHTDSNASDSYNQDLSERRANAVRDMLINRFGIAADRVEAIGYGELRPLATNSTAEGRQLNRRVVAVINERIQTVQ